MSAQGLNIRTRGGSQSRYCMDKIFTFSKSQRGVFVVLLVTIPWAQCIVRLKGSLYFHLRKLTLHSLYLYLHHGECWLKKNFRSWYPLSSILEFRVSCNWNITSSVFAICHAHNCFLTITVFDYLKQQRSVWRQIIQLLEFLIRFADLAEVGGQTSGTIWTENVLTITQKHLRTRVSGWLKFSFQSWNHSRKF